jgi:A/G-specific adenine glycosylase
VNLQYNTFSKIVLDYYAANRRSFEWREDISPYRVIVSEIMLQQTQTERVAYKFPQWLSYFPNFETLAQASTRDVIAAWAGLGYNRRALALHSAAQRVVQEFKGKLPDDPKILETFKGIGPNTAGSICAFAFNKPTIFIETNIRAVYIHHFFPGEEKVHDKQLLPIIEATVDRNNPRDWYYALMDYGVKLKKEHKNPSRKSKHHAVQSKFEGSERQIRGMILRALTEYGKLSFEELTNIILREERRVEKNLSDLISEGFIKNINDYYLL